MISTSVISLPGRPCEEHKSRKQGVCATCRYCKLCLSTICNDAFSHQAPKKRGRKKRKINSPAIEDELLSTGPAPVPEASAFFDTPIPEERTSNSELQLDDIVPQALFRTPDASYRTPAKQYLPSPNPVADLCRALNINYEQSEIPLDGFKAATIRKKSRSQQRAQRVCNLMTASLASLLCPEDPSIALAFLKGNEAPSAKASSTESLKRQGGEAKLTANLLKYCLNSNGSVWEIAQSLLASSFELTACNEMLQAEAQQQCEITDEEVELLEDCNGDIELLDLQPLNLDRSEIAKYTQLMKSKAKIGQFKFASLRSAYEKVIDDQPFPTAAYRCRLDPRKLQLLMEFVQTKLNIRPGIMRNVRMGTAVFENVPVYERGGLSLKRLYEIYASLVDNELRVGNHTFNQLVKLLTKRGECRTGLSSYYVDFKHHDEVLLRMLKRFSELFPEMAVQCKALRTRWEELARFLRFDFVANHIQDESSIQQHCMCYALGQACNHPHRSNVCSSCCEMFALPEDLSSFFKAVPRVNTPCVNEEILTMIDAIKFIKPAIQRYAAHKIRSTHQSKPIATIASAIEKDKTKIMLVCDHKKKVLPQRYREGQQEFFGKKGMSLLGCAEIYLGKTHFSDYVIDGYSKQDNIQVLIAIQIMQQEIKQRYPEVKEIILQSDNASCFASHSHVRHVHMLNKAIDTPKIVQWIFTEAGTGKTSLDCHFSYANLQFQSYVEDGNVMASEPAVFNAMKFGGGIINSSAYLINARSVDTSGLGKPAFKARLIGVRETHDIKWFPEEEFAELRKFTGLKIAEKVSGANLTKHLMPNLGVSVEQKHHSTKISRQSVPTGKRKSILNPKHLVILAALENTVLYRPISPSNAKTEILIDESHPEGCAHAFWETNWARKQNKKEKPMPTSVCELLYKWHLEGLEQKTNCWTGEKALYVLQMDHMKVNWSAQMIVSLQKTTAFFGLKVARMKALANSEDKESGLDQHVVDVAAEAIAESLTLDECDEITQDEDGASKE